VVNRVPGDADVGLGVARQYCVTAIGVASAAREIAATQTDILSFFYRRVTVSACSSVKPTAFSVVDIAKADGSDHAP
jgi:hypothetical protein